MEEMNPDLISVVGRKEKETIDETGNVNLDVSTSVTFHFILITIMVHKAKVICSCFIL